MNLDMLYMRYGKVRIQMKILQGQESELERQIADELNKPKEKKNVVGTDVPPHRDPEQGDGTGSK